MSEDPPFIKDVTFNVQSPFTFSIGTEGQLVVAWLQYIAPGIAIRQNLVIPPEELKTLRAALEHLDSIADTLSARPPSQGPN